MLAAYVVIFLCISCKAELKDVQSDLLSEVTLSSSYTYILVQFEPLTCNEVLRYHVTIEWNKEILQRSIANSLRFDKIKTLPPSTVFNVTITRHDYRNANSTWTFQRKETIRTLTFPPIALRYEIVSSCIKFTWNLPAAFPQEEASELYILFGVENNEMYRFTVAPVTQPNHLIIGLHLYKTYGVDVELGTKRPNKRESFNVLLPLASYQMAMKASEPDFSVDISASLTSMTFQWTPGNFMGTLKFHLETEGSAEVHEENQATGFKTISSLPPDTPYMVTVTGLKLTENVSSDAFAYFAIIRTKKPRVSRLRTLGRSDGIAFLWDTQDNITGDDSKDLCLIFHITIGKLDMVFWQLLNVGYSEISKLFPNQTYVVQVQLGPEKYVLNGLWMRLPIHSVYTIQTINARMPPFRSVSFSDMIAVFWDLDDIFHKKVSSVNFEIEHSNGSRRHVEFLNTGYAELTQLTTNTSYHVTFFMEHFQSSSFNIVTEDGPKCNFIISSTLISLTIRWNPREYGGTLNFVIETSVYRQITEGTPTLGAIQITSLPPDTVFNITITGIFHRDEDSSSAFVYKRSAKTKSMSDIGDKIALRGIGNENRISFYWDIPLLIPFEDMNDLRLIFKVEQDNFIGYFWQWFEVGIVEIKQLHPGRKYNVEVKLGPDVSPSATLWRVLKPYSSYVIETERTSSAPSYPEMFGPRRRYRSMEQLPSFD